MARDTRLRRAALAPIALLILAAGCHPFEDIEDYAYPAGDDTADSSLPDLVPSDADDDEEDDEESDDDVEPDVIEPDVEPDVIEPDLIEPDLVELPCAEGLEVCGGVCVETKTDPSHCGECGVVCADGTECRAGTCVSFSCLEPLIACDGVCVDARTDEARCGACDTSCASSQVCDEGRCVTVEYHDLRVGEDHACILRTVGPLTSPICWGFNGGPNVDGRLGHTNGPAPGLVLIDGHEVVALSAGARHSCAIVAAGGVWCWGDNTSAQSAPSEDQSAVLAPTPLPPNGGVEVWHRIAAGGAHSCAGTNDGLVACWGSGQNPQPDGVGGPLHDLASGTGFVCALHDAEAGAKPGVIDCWSMDPNAPGAFRVTGELYHELEAGTGHGCALDAAGALWCWGRNDEGQIDPQLAEPGAFTQAPVEVPIGSPIDALGLGNTQTCVAIDQEIRCRGAERTGATPSTARVVPHPLGQSWVEVDAGRAHVCALDDLGEVYCRGDNDRGQLGDASAPSGMLHKVDLASVDL